MNRIAIMQPYTFPYIGYFQLIMAVDRFVFFDDVQFIRRGYINKNAILSNHQASSFTIPVQKASRDTAINEVQIHPEMYTNWRTKFFKSIQASYGRAPEFEKVYPLVEKVFQQTHSSISDLARTSIIETCTYLDLQKEFLKSSAINYDRSGNGEEKIISISKELRADTYINAQNGKSLYSEPAFDREKINLRFIAPGLPVYKQYKEEFVNYLSIIDVLMFNSIPEVRSYLTNYKLETKEVPHDAK